MARDAAILPESASAESIVRGTARKGRAVEAVRLAPNRVYEAGEVIGRACADDPLLAYIVPDRAERTRQALAAAGHVLVRFGLRFGSVDVVGSPIDGVVISLTPMHLLAVPLRIAWTLQAAIGLGLPPAGLIRLSRVAFQTGRAARRAVPPPHHRLLLLAVNPAQRGQGVDAALLRSVLRHADAAGRPCVTATGYAHTVLFLSAHGFQVVADHGLPGAGLRLWTLVRLPQK